MALLEIRHAAKSYGTGSRRTEVLADIDLAIAEGEFVAIVGYSGSGKSTLLHLLSGLVRPDVGSVMVDGRPITGPGPDRGVVFQNYSLLPWLTVHENIALAVDRVHPEWSREQRRAHVAHHIALVKLTPARDRRPRELSGGMRQRVSLARTLAMQPRILLMDEPFGALDALTRGTLQQETLQLWEAERRTVVLITNDPDEAILMADRVLPLRPGPRATLGPALAVSLPRPRRRDALHHHPDFRRLRAELVDFLLAAARGRQDRDGSSRLPRLPDLTPDDGRLRRTFRWPRWPARTPRRRAGHADRR